MSAAVTERHPEAAIIMPPRSTAVPSETAEIDVAVTALNRMLDFGRPISARIA